MDTAAAALAAATARAEDAAAHVEHARAQRAASVRADLVAALRPNLVVGEECPVCAQAVAVLPERLPEGDLAAADRALAAAEAALDRGRRAEAVATAEHARAAAARTSAADTVERLTAALAGIVPVSTDLAPTRPAAPRPDPTIPTTVDASTQSGFADPRPESTSTLSACRTVDEAVTSPAGRAAAGVDLSADTEASVRPVREVGGSNGSLPGSIVVAADGERDDAGVAPHERAVAVPSAEMIESALAHLDQLATAARAADERLRRARAERDAAAAEVEAVRAHAASAATALRNAREPLVGFGAPPVDDSEPSAGWAALVEWAGREADAREAALPAARVRYREVQDVHATAERALQSAEEVAERRRREETAAARAEQEASGLVEQLERRDRELVVALRDAPDDDAAAAALTRIGELEDTVRAADAALRSARAAARAAEDTASAVEREVATAWAELRTARDPWSPSTPPPSVTISSARGRSSWPGRGPRQKNVPRKHTGPRKAAPRSRPAAAPSSGGSSTTSPPTTSRWRPLHSAEPAPPRRPMAPPEPSTRPPTPPAAPRPPQRWAVLSSHRPQRLPPLAAPWSRSPRPPRPRSSRGPRRRPSRPRWSGPEGRTRGRRAAGRGRRAHRRSRRGRRGPAGREDARPPPALRRLPAMAGGVGARRAGRRRVGQPGRALGRPVRAHPRERGVPRGRPHRRRRPQAGEDPVRRGDLPGQPGAGVGAVGADVGARRPRRRPARVDLPRRGVRHPRRSQPGDGRGHPGGPRFPRRPDGRRDHPRARPRRTGAGAVRRLPRPAQLVRHPGGPA